MDYDGMVIENAGFSLYTNEVPEKPVQYHWPKSAYSASEAIGVLLQHHRWLRYQVRRRTPNLQPDDRDDIEQEVYVRVLRWWTPDVRDLQSWTVRLVDSAVARFFRDQRPQAEVLADDIASYGTHSIGGRARENGPRRLPHEDEQHR